MRTLHDDSAGPDSCQSEKHVRNVLISTVAFGSHDRHPLDLLQPAGARVTVNPIGRRLQEQELAEFISESHILIAGTEPITREVMEAASNLRLIARVRRWTRQC